MNTPMKRCRACGGDFPYSELVKAIGYSGGVKPLCKACRRISRRKPKPIPTTKPGYKICLDCKRELPFDDLVKSSNCADGVRALCKECKNIRNQKAYADDLDKSRKRVREKMKRLRDADPDGTRAKNKEWRTANPDKYRISKRKSDTSYYRRNQDDLNEKSKAYSRTHPKYWRARNARRRARKRQAEGYYTREDVKSQYDKQNGLCFWCSQPLAKFHVDHVIPLSRGGSNWPANLVCSCPTCNFNKHDRLPYSEWQPPKPLK